jgi:hypothetical protein
VVAVYVVCAVVVGAILYVQFHRAGLVAALGLIGAGIGGLGADFSRRGRR